MNCGVLKNAKLVKKGIKVFALVSILSIGIIANKNIVNAATDATIAGITNITPAAQIGTTQSVQGTIIAEGPAVEPIVATTPAVDNAGLITVDLVIFAGQSNMSGVGGNVEDAPSVANGHGYEFREGMCPTGLYTVEEPFGIYQNGYLCDPIGIRSGSLVSAFMNTYYKKTNVPVLGISAARGGTSITYWNQPEVQKDLMAKYQSAKAWCASNNVKIRHQYVVWLQGETDAIAAMSAEDYKIALKDAFIPVLTQGIEQVFVITIGNCAGFPGAYDVIVGAQEELCEIDPYFTLGTNVLHTLPDSCTPDTIHYDQKSLNKAGNLCATTAAAYSLMKR